MSYHAIAAQCIETSRARGFVATTWEDVPIRLCGIHSEIGELVQAIESESVREMSLESADIAALALIIMHDLGATNWVFRGRMHGGPRASASAGDVVRKLHYYVDMAYAAWRQDKRGDVLVCLELLVAQLVDIRVRCLRLPNDLHFDLQCKLAINTGRSPRNGGRNARS